jgi:hypothetical protein
MYPRRSPTTHTEQLGDEASVYDWARAQVHALNPTAACVWRHCDGATSPDAIAAALRVETGVPEAEAVVDLTLAQLARLHLLELPVESRNDRPATTRRWLLGRGVAAAMLPAIYSIVAPSPVEAQSTGAGAPMLASLSPNQGIRGTTVAVTLTGARFVAGATTVSVSGGGVTVTNVTVSGGTPLTATARRGRSLTAAVSTGTSLTANFVIDPAAAEGPRNVMVTTAAGTSGAQIFTVTVPLPPGTPTLTSVLPNQGVRGTTVAVTLTGTNFVIGATTVTVGGSGATVTNVAVSNGTSLTANFVLDPAAPVGSRTVTVTTAAGTSGPRIFTISLPPPGAPTLTSVTPNEGIQDTTVAVTLTGTNFIVGATTVNISGSGVTVNNVVVAGSTSLTASFVLGPAAAAGARSVTVTTAAGTSGAQTFTIDLPPGPGIPTLTSVSPNQGLRGTTVAVTLTGTNFVVGATTVNVGGGMTATNIVVGSSTSLTANFVLDPAAVVGPRIVTVTTAGGTSVPQGFSVSQPPPTLTSVSPNQGVRGETVAVTLTGTNFVGGATTVTVGGGGVTVTNVIVGSATSLTASFVLDVTAAGGARTVTVTTAGGTSGAQPFTINLPPPGSATFTYTGSEQLFTVPAGVVAITIDATGAAGGKGSGAEELGPARSMGGRTTATVSVAPGRLLTVRVGGSGQDGRSPSTAGGFNGGGASAGNGGGGGGASSVRDGSIPLVIAGGGGGGGGSIDVLGGVGGAGGGLTAAAGESAGLVGGGGGGGGTQAAGGGGGTKGNPGGTDGTAGIAGSGGVGGIAVAGNAVRGGGGGGGGYFGGGGGGGGGAGIGDIDGGGGGGGSSFAAPGATGVAHQQGGNTGAGSVTITW